MKIKSHKITIQINAKEISVWLAALRQAAREHVKYGSGIDNNPFIKQHREITYNLGFNEDELKYLIEELEKKEKENE